MGSDLDGGELAVNWKWWARPSSGGYISWPVILNDAEGREVAGTLIVQSTPLRQVARAIELYITEEDLAKLMAKLGQ